MFASRLLNVARQFSTSAARQGLHGGRIGENLPFRIDNHRRLTLVFAIFFGTGAAAPFLVVLHQLEKKSSN